MLSDWDVTNGQIAHLNRDRTDPRFENLVWLCLDHHNEYDSRPSQSKGLMLEEVREWRDELHAHYKSQQPAAAAVELLDLDDGDLYAKLRTQFPGELAHRNRAWRYPFGLAADERSLFAYKASNGADGVCLLERVDLPDARVVIACTETAGNPGQSTTNAIERICHQVCERFGISPERLVWLDHCEDDQVEWNVVNFGGRPPTRPFESPTWTPMTDATWADLRLQPANHQPQSLTASRLTKLFAWPPEDA